MPHIRPPIRRGKRCRVPFCGVTSTPQWGNGPDGPYTLCNCCYNKYRNRELKLYRDERTRKLTVVPGRFSYRVRHVGFHRRGGAGLRKDISRPIVENFGGQMRSLIQEPSRPVSAMKKRMRNLAMSPYHAPGRLRACLIEGCRRAAVADGPDGEGTLCKPCFMKYAERKMPLYQAPDGIVSVVKKFGWRQVRVTNFVDGPDGSIDGRHPVVSPWVREGRKEHAAGLMVVGNLGKKHEGKRVRCREMFQEKSMQGQNGSPKRARTDTAQVNRSNSVAVRRDGISTSKGETRPFHVRTDREKHIPSREASHPRIEKCRGTTREVEKHGKVIGIRFKTLTRRVRLGKISFAELRKCSRALFGWKEDDIIISYPDEENQTTWIRSEDDIEEFVDVMNLTANRPMTVDVENMNDSSNRGYTGDDFGRLRTSQILGKNSWHGSWKASMTESPRARKIVEQCLTCD